MNKQNISALGKQLEALGFEKTSSSLSKRICFKPHSFSLPFLIEKDKDKLSFLVHFEKDKKEDGYVLMFHDAVLHKEIIIPETNIEGINVRTLEKQISAIDWKKAFDLNDENPWLGEDETSWEQEEKVEIIIASLMALQKNEEGKDIASSLKEKYWSNISFPEFIRFVAPLKTKLEVSQRFYFFEGQPGISVEEAYRFLQNKWMEKQIQSSRRRTEFNLADDKNEASSAGHSLLKLKKQQKLK